MTKAFLLKKTGTSDVLKLTNVNLPDPAADEVRVRNSYIAVSHMDIHHRNGTYSLSTFPRVIGISGCGSIVKLGAGGKEFQVGEKVVYGTNFVGSYSEEVNIKQNCLIGMPDGIAEDTVVASYVPGLAAHYLIYRTYKVTKNSVILVNGATGSVGHILCQWLSSIGAYVIGVVGNQGKVSAAKSYGCKYIVNHGEEDVVARVMELTKNCGVNVIYDCYGKSFFEKNTQMLSPLGLLINYGDVTGLIDNLDVTKLWDRCLFYTKPNLSVYKGNRMELVLSAESLFKNIIDKVLNPIFTTVNFKDLPKAHALIESGKNSGTIIAKV